ncbi:MAG: hypothetical protein PHN84_08425 [Desulfuromonadaceae bacterium]|nr:hypothetical protein [Desulfuromonadaceae bacterium]MDD2857029.1 hypothetical protein [Desulfuromonadaceae bacterium]
MRNFANLFLILFLADGGFSLVDELVPLLTPLMPFTGLRLLLAGNVIVMAAIIYFCLGIDSRLPKKLFIPLIFFAIFFPLTVWFFPVLEGLPALGLIGALLQLLLGMLPLYYFRKGDDRSLIMPPELFSGSYFKLKNSLIFFGVNLVIVPFLLIVFSMSTVDAYMAEYTSGFMHINPGGLRMSERTYTQGGKSVRLAAMIHIADKEYYDSLTSSLSTGRAIVLAEGVSDTGKLLGNSIDYGKIASYLGLQSQHDMNFGGRLINPDDLESVKSPLVKSEAGKKSFSLDILRADVDAADFRPSTILILNSLGKKLQGSPSFLDAFTALNRWGEKNITPEMSEILMDDILYKRNIKVIGYLDRALLNYDTVVIPWGALHMKEIEAEVLKRGFKLQNERVRVSIDFGKMLMTML